jgi:hypothetical protein
MVVEYKLILIAGRCSAISPQLRLSFRSRSPGVLTHELPTKLQSCVDN